MPNMQEGDFDDLGVYVCHHPPRKLYGVEYETLSGLEYYYAYLCEKCAQSNLVPYGRVFVLKEKLKL
ncbi:MAG: hypothetical protein U9R04_02485 [Chloroflexota bacterium]|nr:hypothetical protein [Chloroflexota bacterium]